MGDKKYDFHIAFCCPVRNCGKYLSSIFKNIGLLKANPKYKISSVFAYDHCRDNSAELLLEYQKTDPHNIYVKNIENNNVLRTARIATARNACIDVVYNELKNVDYHIMIDCDDVNIYKWDVELLDKYFRNFDNDDWDCISFKRNQYYDVWALLIDNYRHQCWGFGPYSRKAVSLMKKYVNGKLREARIKGKNSIECLSAFQAFAIHKTNKFKNIRYDGFYSNVKKLITDEERASTFKMFREKHGCEIYEHDGSRILDNKKGCKEECCCEHIFYNVSATRKNKCKIKISIFNYFLMNKGRGVEFTND